MHKIEICRNYNFNGMVTPVILFNQKINQNKTYNKKTDKIYIKYTVMIPTPVFNYFNNKKLLYLVNENNGVYEIKEHYNNKNYYRIIINKLNRFVLPVKIISSGLSYVSFVYVPIEDTIYLLIN